MSQQVDSGEVDNVFEGLIGMQGEKLWIGDCLS